MPEMPSVIEVVDTSTSNVIEIIEEINSIEIVDRAMQGASGASAYEIAVAQGFVGTVDEWLVSLKGVIVLDADEDLPPPNTPVDTLVYRRVS